VMLRWQGKVKAAVEQKHTATEKFCALCQTALLYLSEDKSFCALLKNDPTIFPMFPESDPYEDINAESTAMIGRILDEGQANGEFRTLDSKVVSELIFTMYKGFIIRAYIENEERFIENYMPHALDLIAKGILRK
jgi:hypothetical protein